MITATVMYANARVMANCLVLDCSMNARFAVALVKTYPDADVH